MSTETLKDEVALIRSVLNAYPSSIARFDALRALARIENMPHGVTLDQVRTLLGWPQMLRLLADYHSVQETEAGALDHEFFADAVKHHEERRKFFAAEADRIEKEWGI